MLVGCVVCKNTIITKFLTPRWMLTNIKRQDHEFHDESFYKLHQHGL